MTDQLSPASIPTLEAPPASLAAQRPAVFEGVDASARALFRPDEPGALPLVDRVAAALRTALWHRDAELDQRYRTLLREAGGSDSLTAAAAAGAGASNQSMVTAQHSDRHRAIFAHVDLLATRPVDATPGHQQVLEEAGLTVREIVTLSQVVAFVSFQVRAGVTLRALRGETTGTGTEEIRVATARHAFTQELLGWDPWLPPLDLVNATEQQRAALPPPRDGSPYFRLLALDAPVLTARTATDEAIFRTPGGLPRGERELSATVSSRVNGCVYCASVHSRFASTFSHRSEDVRRLLDGGPSAPQEPRWRAIIDAAAALSQAPPVLCDAHLTPLRGQGLVDLEIFDLGMATAFFAWANRLMLTLGQPVFPQP